MRDTATNEHTVKKEKKNRHRTWTWISISAKCGKEYTDATIWETKGARVYVCVCVFIYIYGNLVHTADTLVLLGWNFYFCFRCCCCCHTLTVYEIPMCEYTQSICSEMSRVLSPFRCTVSHSLFPSLLFLSFFLSFDVYLSVLLFFSVMLRLYTYLCCLYTFSSSFCDAVTNSIVATLLLDCISL